MKTKTSFFAVLLLVTNLAMAQKLTVKWQSDTLFRTPESTLYYPKLNIIYVANINGVGLNVGKKDGDGFISKLRPNGKIENLKWATDLNDPKGMGIWGNSLFVADLTDLVEIDIKTGKILHKINAEKSVMLNDVSVSPKGEVFASDSRGHKIYRYFEGKMELWLDDPELKSPNGLFVTKDYLIVASAGTGKILKVDYLTKKYETWTNASDTADGIIKDNKGDYWISCWKGEIYHISKDNSSQKIIDSKEQKINTADMGFIAKENIMLVPTFYKNSVIAYKID